MKQKSKNYEEEYVQINGIEHYFLHYNVQMDAPLLLFLHGGPGQSEAMLPYLVEEYEDRNYNIVYYDQRGAGKTYLRNKKARPDTELLKKDLLEVVLYLKKIYQKEKIGILGHSWGSVLGSMFALEHPEHTLCYIGCGQVVNLMENERTGFARLKAAVTASGNKSHMRRLKKIGEYPGTGGFDRKAFRQMGQVRSLQGKYHLAVDMDKNMIKIFMRSPVMGITDILPFITGMIVNMQVMGELMAFDLRKKGSDYRVPVYYVLGENDQQTPVELGTAYFEEITAPDKKLYLIKDAGHVMMLDNIRDYRAAVCEIVERVCKK
ncbi:MAG: alpha/beta hydrolase [Ruminococcus sp.]|nr:alpha/beta hydrolase [Ruminococcus sp.]